MSNKTENTNNSASGQREYPQVSPISAGVTADATADVTVTVDSSPKLPKSVPYIIGNELTERFSFYGMKAILMTYMMAPMYLNMSESAASSYGHMFNFGVYFLPFIGALLSDFLFGKYRVILWLSLVYCVGHLILALPGTWFAGNLQTPLFWGLLCIAIGAGGIKSCVSALVGDQFTKENQSLIERVYGWFYLSINVGSFFSMLLTPYLFEVCGPEVAFGVPGVLMAISTFIFWLGRKKYKHVPAAGTTVFRDCMSREGAMAILKVSFVFLFLIVFWAVYDQSSFRWVSQAKQMNTQMFGGISFLPQWLQNYKVLPAQVQAVNPFLILMFIPLFSYVLYPLIDRFYHLTLVRKMRIGLFLGAIAALFPLYFEMGFRDGVSINIAWQVVAYIVLTAAEVMVSVTSLEFAYTQAPRSMKSIIMGMYLMTIAFGNLLVSQLNHWCDQNPAFLPGVSYYQFFVVVSLINAGIFFFVAWFYKEKVYLQS